MQFKFLLIIILSILILLSAFGYYFLYNVYGTEIRLSPNELFADPGSVITIEVVPVNALGIKALWRYSSAKFEFVEGSHLVEKVFIDEDKGILKLRSIGKAGKVLLKIESNYSMLKEYLEIEIKSLTA